MLYWITQQFTARISGLHVFSYLTFRAILATASALGLSLVIGPSMIERLSRYQIGQVVRDDGPASHDHSGDRSWLYKSGRTRVDRRSVDRALWTMSAFRGVAVEFDGRFFAHLDPLQPPRR